MVDWKFVLCEDVWGSRCEKLMFDADTEEEDQVDLYRNLTKTWTHS